MARQVLPFVGLVVGAAFGAPQLGFAIGTILGNAVDPQVVSGPKIGEAGLQTSAEGVFRPIVFGTGAVKGNVIERGNRQVVTQRTQQGKGGGPVVEEQRVYWTFAIRIAEGPIAGLLRIWQDEKLVYDIRPGSPIPDETAAFADRFRLYLGDETQLPDPDLEAYKGMGNVNAYRGTAYIVFPNYDLTDRRESIPDFRFEVSTEGQIVTAGRWIFGPVAQNGPAGGSEGYYVTADNPEDLPTATPVAIPGWMGGVLGRISSANGNCFLHAGLSDNASVSFDGGATFQECDSPLTAASNVTWSGQNYYCGSLRSANGINWTTTPNLSATPHDVVGGNGMVIAMYQALTNRIEVSVNEAASWTSHNTIGNWAPVRLPLVGPSGRVHFTLDSNRGLYTDDEFQTQTQDAFPFPFLRAFVSSGGMVIGRSFNAVSTIVKSTDNGITYESILSSGGSATFGSNSDNIFAYGDSIMVTDQVFSASPVRHVLKISTNFGDNWSDSSDLYGNGTNIAFIGGGTSASAGPVSLSYIVSTLHERIGQDSTYYDVSELTDELAGLVLAGDYSAADAIRTLMPIYSFDGAEYDSGSGYRIHYRKRGKPVVTTITVDQLIEAPERSVREDALERPKRLHLHYENPTVGYAPAKATVIRNSQDILVVGERSVQVPVSFTDVDEPAQIADKLMRQTWVEVGGEEEFVIPDNLISLVPSDCVGVSLRGQVRRMRIVSQGIGGGRLRLRMLPDRQSAYTSNITGVPVPEPTPPLPSIVGMTIYSPMDIPALNDNNDSLIWYDAATGQTPAWYGAQTQHKAGAAVEFENSATFNQNTIMGALLETLPAASEHYTDTTNTVRIQLYTDDDIPALTQEQFLSEGGSFALDNGDGTWELLQYRDVLDEGDGLFTLSYLARGRLNTGGSQHEIGGRFVLLDAVRSVPAVTAWINTPITHRAVSFGNSPDSAEQVVETYTAKSQTEFPVANILLERDTNTINVRVVPRHRFGTEDNPVVSSNWVGYRITATDGVNTSEVLTLSATTSFDVTGWATPVTVTATQRNRFTGDGPSVSEDIV